LKHFKSSDELRNIFNLPFFKNIIDPEYYVQKYETGSSDVDINLKQLNVADYKNKLFEQVKEVVKSEYSEEFDQERRKKQSMADSVASVLDDDSFYPEPIEVKEQPDEGKYLPWWKKLGLKVDPFPTYDKPPNIIKLHLIIKNSCCYLQL